MNQGFGSCPVCGGEMRVARMLCRQCGASLEGDFQLGQFLKLSPEQMHFVDVFLKCRGKIKDVEEELGVSYPTVVARLNEITEALGYEAAPAEEELGELRRQILDDLAEGKIDASEAATRLRELRER
ncbi:MAG: DUF2089 domain-containing protein [Dehalococcoidia bacterium]